MDSNGENLIFLISQPRSGSTLLQLILAGHGDIATTSEPWLALHPAYGLRDGKTMKTDYDAVLASLGVAHFLKESGIGEVAYKERLGGFLSSLYDEAIKRDNARYFLDKTPRYYNIIPELIELFPGARFIVLLRHPLAVLSSILKTWVKGDMGRLARHYKRDLVDAPALLLDGMELLGDSVFTVRYDELVMEPEMTIDSVCNFLGIDYSDGLIDYAGRADKDWEFGDKVGIHKRTRPSKDSLDAWHNGFKTPQELHLAHAYLRTLGKETFSDMGYDFVEALSLLSPESEGGEDIIPWELLVREPADIVDRLELELTLNDALIGDMEKRFNLETARENEAGGKQDVASGFISSLMEKFKHGR